MSNIMRRLTQIRSPLTSRPLASSFHTSTPRSVLSESDHDHVSTDTSKPSRDAKIDHHKADTVNKAKSGKGEWKSELASNSEQTVKADKSGMSMEEMKRAGEKKGEEEK